METVFLHILNISITATWLVLAIVLMRLLLKKAPKALRVLLWALVGIRLICPFAIESVFSVIPSAETVPTDILFADAPAIQSGIPILNSTVNPLLSAAGAPETGASVNPMQSIVYIASIVWVVGVAVMLCYGIIAFLRLRQKVKVSLLYRDNIYLCDSVDSPFILGIFKPRIYLPSDIDEAQASYVIAHEKAHLKRKDHIWKPLGFLLLSVYWFNPALWAAYIFLCRDIELACDEKVIKRMLDSDKKGYSEALVACSVQRRKIMACPLAFGEVGVKERIRSVLSYKKPAFWVILAAIVLSAAVAVAFLTNPPAKSADDTVTVYSYSDSAEPLAPTIILDEKEQRFQFTYSALSSYIGMGTYTLTKDTLTLTTEDGMNTYVFNVKNDTFVFDAKRSSPIPEYRYSGSSAETKSPVPDGAVFQRMPSEEKEDLPLTLSPSEELQQIETPQISISRVSYAAGGELMNSSLNTDKMAVSAVRHLPIYQFETLSELQQFKSTYGNKLNIQKEYTGFPSFEHVTESMDEAFFKKYTVFVVYVTANSGSVRYGVKNIELDGENLCIHVQITDAPEVGTADMAAWLITVTMPKDDVKNVTSFDADLDSSEGRLPKRRK